MVSVCLDLRHILKRLQYDYNTNSKNTNTIILFDIDSVSKLIALIEVLTNQENTMTTKKLLIEAKLNKTYWGKKILAAKERGSFTEEDTVQASVWQTCACGKLDHRIPKQTKSSVFGSMVDAPLDKMLNELGTSFARDVSGDDFEAAAKTMIQIEARAIEILKNLDS